MPHDPANPYASPAEAAASTGSDLEAAASAGIDFDPAVRQKIATVAKDAEQFWLAILLTIFCSGLAMIVVGPWYLMRLIQWHSLSREYPRLMEPDVPRGGLEHRFQKARTKLIVGFAFGGVVLLLGLLYLLTAAVVQPPAIPEMLPSVH